MELKLLASYETSLESKSIDFERICLIELTGVAISAHTRTHARTHARTHTHTCINSYIHIHIIHARAHTHTLLYTHTHSLSLSLSLSHTHTHRERENTHEMCAGKDCACATRAYVRAEGPDLIPQRTATLNPRT